MDPGQILMGMNPMCMRKSRAQRPYAEQVFKPPAFIPMELMSMPVDELMQGAPTMKSVLMHDGSKLSFCSAGAQFGQVVLLGSPYNSGLLRCAVP
ncbi:unnamed protein product [Polarella glacialis]|uniref:Uncharacterized protein n=1 Tax=Polarella glacialis TaxID=89957 RepID=A0A813ILI2_POLGL|nr:unnamed protein product [Polarella glacialis]